MTMLKKTFDIDFKFADGEDRVFEGYGSTFGNKDRHGDVVVKGAFAKSLKGMQPAMLMHHDMRRPIGVWTEMKEDDNGLFVKGELTAGVQDADEAYALLKAGALHSMSIGFIPKIEEYDRNKDTNYIKEIELWEVSLVTIPANASATVAAVKDAEGNFDIRELERVLRDAGLSRRDAKAFISDGASALTPKEVTAQDILAAINNY